MGAAFRSEGGSALGWQAKGGYRLLPTFSTSLFYWKSSSGADISSGGSQFSNSFSVSSFGAEALYRFAGSFWSLGLKAGFMKKSAEASVSGVAGDAKVTDSHTSAMLAPTTTYEIPLGRISVGAEGSYFYSLSDSVPKAVSLMAMIRYLF